jgi:hypothetical protein
MSGTHQDAMQCNEFEALLSDALDGTLAGPRLEHFQTHRASCALCGLLFAEAEAGKGWLQGLREVEPPRNLVHNILAATSGVQATAPAAGERGLLSRLPGWMIPALKPVLQPRFAMSFAMAFFSVSLMMNLAGVRVSDVRNVDLRPSAVVNGTVRTFQETTARVEKYYENLRLVYEIESRVRELKNAAAPVGNPEPVKDKEKKVPNDNTSEQPDRQKSNEYYSLEFAGLTWA